MNTQEIPVSVVGLGLMGCSIVTCLLIAGHPVVAVAPIPIDLDHAEDRIREHLEKSLENGLVENPPEYYFKNLTITEDYADLRNCRLTIECTIENVMIKEQVYKKIEAHLPPDALLTSNTSAIPISTLQQMTQHPSRFLGLHWTEPAHTTRFLEDNLRQRNGHQER